MSLTNDIDHNSSVNVPYVAGRLKQFVSVWQTITSDYCILSSIKGVKIEFVDCPKQTMIPREYNFDATEVVIIDKQIEKFLQTGVIETTTHCKGEYISNIFIRPKKDGSYRLILNLKNLNQFVQYHHFKMENLKSAITLMSPNCYMASIDLKDAYYSVSIDTTHRKYLHFIWKNQLFQFTCLPNGLSSAPRIFTKLMKPAYSTLRCKGFENVGYIDDTYSAAQIYPNQNIRVIRVSPIRVYAYTYTQMRVCIYTYTRIQCMRVCLISMYELTYCFFVCNRSLFLATEQERVFISLNTCIQYTRVCLQTRLDKMLAETAETNILQLITLTEN